MVFVCLSNCQYLDRECWSLSRRKCSRIGLDLHVTLTKRGLNADRSRKIVERDKTINEIFQDTPNLVPKAEVSDAAADHRRCCLECSTWLRRLFTDKPMTRTSVLLSEENARLIFEYWTSRRGSTSTTTTKELSEEFHRSIWKLQSETKKRKTRSAAASIHQIVKRRRRM